MTLVTSVLVVVAAALFVFAAGFLTSDSEAVVDPAPPQTFRAVEGTVGRTLQLSARTEWAARFDVRSRSLGTVTRIAEPELLDALAAGDELLAIDERPVLVAVGETPRYRDLGQGMSGRDVFALQDFLVEQGFETQVDGEFGRSTRSAVQAWQRSLGLDDDGLVRMGDLLFLPALPVRFVIDPSVEQGTLVADQTVIGTVYEPDPDFVVQVQPEQAVLLPGGTEAEIEVGGGRIEATVLATSVDPESGLQSVLLDYERPCGVSCAVLNGGEISQHPVDFVLVPETTGVTVPIAFIATGVDGEALVVNLDGERVGVHVVAVADGMAVVDGIDIGEVVQRPDSRTAG